MSNQVKCFAALIFFSGCTDISLPEDPCELADAPVSERTLILSSLSGAYDACLDSMRAKAYSLME